ncbi:MAG: pilus assembly protein [Sphingomonadales bacterium]|nr:pilus assembly protein [Sphingomonadales bacterium]
MRRANLFQGLSRFAAARDGNAVIEFAIVAPVFLLMLLGIFDIGQMAYGKAILNGAVEQAARSGTLETADTTVADNMVKAALKPILPNATIATTRKSYYDFNDVARPEKFTDTNGNGTCNTGEPYVDENKNGQWDADIGNSGNGSANDVVLYTVTVTYKPIFRLTTMNGWNNNRTLTAVGVRKNQPFANQTGYGSSAGTCP